MSSFAKRVLVLWLLTLLSSHNVLGGNDTGVQYPRGFSLFPTIHVRVTNTLEGGLDLTVHCKSGDDDIGVQFLHPNAFFQFKFHINFFGTTLFFCGFRWKDAFHWFNIYDGNRDENRCKNCYWIVKKSGPCLFANDNSTDCYSWNKS
uniref:S-protein homolog n=1 Tax=Cajanus cajan TaxID=3821 RepID=A0A151TBL0_CAJCA|nr:hypothetical protein KK1_019037 [Cajanus cajan]